MFPASFKKKTKKTSSKMLKSALPKKKDPLGEKLATMRAQGKFGRGKS